MGFRILTGAIALLLLSAGIARAQAWVQPRGGVYFKLSGTYLNTKREFDFEGNRQSVFADDESLSNTSFRELSTAPYLEYGITDRFTLVASLPFKRVTSKETVTPFPLVPITQRIERTNSGPSDLFLSVRTSLVEGSSAVAVQSGIKIPLGYAKAPDNEGPPLGTGDFDGELHIAYGYSLYPLPSYVSASVGYRVRGGELHDEFLYSVEGGHTMGRLFVKLRFDALQSTTTPPDLAGPTFTSFTGGTRTFGDIVVGDQDAFKLNPLVSFAFTESLALSGEIFHVVAGKNTVAGTAFSGGLVYTRR